MKNLFLLLVFLLSSISQAAPGDSINYKNRKILLGAGAAGIATIGSTGLYFAWYRNYNSGNFHSFNDNSEWLQMDKAGHSTTTYIIGAAGYSTCRWSGMNEKKSILYGGSSGLAYMTIIECMDGLSEGWGFSWGDMAANASGTLVFSAQQYFWKEQRIRLKYSFHQSNYWSYRKDLLGENLLGQSLKDYNGQSYWVTVNIASFLNKENKFPKWINIALGYGANGMISGKDDYLIVKADGSVIGGERYRRYFLSLDVDLSKIKTKSKILKSVFKTINFIKVPFPALELSNKKISAHYLYF